MSVNSLHITDSVLEELRQTTQMIMTYGDGIIPVPGPVLMGLLERLRDLEHDLKKAQAELSDFNWELHRLKCRDEWG